MTYWLNHEPEPEPEPYHQSVIRDYDLDEQVKDKMVDYLEKNKNGVIRIDGYNEDADEYEVRYIPMLHRWKPEYKRRVMAKTYAVNEWYKKNRMPVTLITFTTRQADLSIPDQVTLLRESFNKVKKVMNRHLGHFPYLWVIESHKSGMSHLHMLYFGPELPVELQGDGKNDRGLIRNLWEKKYDAGKIVDFSFSPSQRSLNNAGGYVFKYLSKTLSFEALADRDSGYFLLSSWVREMSRRDSHYTGVRFWDCSRDLKDAMLLNRAASPVIWFRSNIKTDKGWFPMWISPDLWGDAESDVLIKFDNWLASLPIANIAVPACASGGDVV